MYIFGTDNIAVHYYSTKYYIEFFGKLEKNQQNCTPKWTNNV